MDLESNTVVLIIYELVYKQITLDCSLLTSCSAGNSSAISRMEQLLQPCTSLWA